MAVAAEQVARAAAVPAPARAPARAPRPRERAATRPRAARRPRLGRSVLWIGVVAALLAGIVALNVAVLQLRIERGRVGSDIAKLHAENAELQAQLSSAAAAGRIESLARARLGLAESSQTTYLELDPGGK